MEKSLVLTLCIFIALMTRLDGINVCGQPNPSVISVPNDYGTIQEAVNNASPGGTIFVSSGLYYEHVVVNKTLNLVGESRETTIVDGSNLGTVIRVTADNVKITGFKLQNSGWKWGRSGVEVYNADNCEIENNFVYLTCHQIRLVGSQGSKVASNVVSAPSNPFPQSAYGIRLENCTNCLVIENNVSNNIGGIHFQGSVNCTATRNQVFQNSQGIRLYSPCVKNKLVGNTVYNNTNDGMLVALPTNTTFSENMFFHNNFINNSQSFIGDIAGCIWDNGFEGNYWTSYKGEDADQNGIGDTPYSVGQQQDRYPLMGRHYEYQIPRQGKMAEVELTCNFAILNLLYDELKSSDSAAVTLSINRGIEEPLFCRISFPTELIGRPYSIEVDGSFESNTTLKELPASNGTHAFIYFTHSGAASTVAIFGTSTTENQYQAPPYPIIGAALVSALAIAILALFWKRRRRNAKKPSP